MKNIFLVLTISFSSILMADTCQILEEAKQTLAACEQNISDIDLQISQEQSAINQLYSDLNQPIEYEIRECRAGNRARMREIQDISSYNEELNVQIRDNRSEIRELRSDLRSKTAYWECVLADRKNMWVAVGTGETAQDAFRNARYESGPMKDQYRKHGYWKPTASQIGERRPVGGRNPKRLRVHQPSVFRDGKAGRDHGYCFRVFKNQNVPKLNSPNQLYVQN